MAKTVKCEGKLDAQTLCLRVCVVFLFFLPMEEAPKRLRSVEKKRTSTCLFADRVAEAVLEKFHGVEIPNKEVKETLLQSQTCVSAVVVVDETHTLSVVSIGVGTRIVSESVAQLDALHGKVVLDSHAEVLARRAFIRYLYFQLELLQSGNSDSIFIQRGDGGIVLKPTITFHLYCSSSPCGNSCVRRWAKGETERFREDLGEREWPDPTKHGKLQIHNPLQVAVLCKVKVGEKEEEEVNPLEIPPGTALPHTKLASSRASCSDKVARWCRLGMEGALFGSLLGGEPGGLRLTSVIVGRKFSRPHLERAICCRVTPKQCKTSMMCTSVKLQQGGLEDTAKFCEYSLVWSLSDDQYEILKEGVVWGTGEPSMVSRSALFALFGKATNQPTLQMSEYSKCKLAVTHQATAAQEFFQCMKTWPRYRSKEAAAVNDSIQPI